MRTDAGHTEAPLTKQLLSEANPLTQIEMLRQKVDSSSGLAERLFQKYVNTNIRSPGPANNENYRYLKREWWRYYIHNAAKGYHNAELFKASLEIQSAIKIAPEKKLGYILFHHVFEKINSNDLLEFNRMYSGAELLVVHVTCQARLENATASVASFRGELDATKHLIVVGDSELEKTSFKFQPSASLLTVPASDSYEGLPAKIRNLFLFLGFSHLQAPVLKIDDDVVCQDIRLFNKSVTDVVAKQDYGGFVIGQGPFVIAPFWHLGKCSEKSINSTPDSLLLLASYAKGSCYWLGPEAVNLISKISLAHDRHFETEIFEDRAIGAALAMYGIRPYSFSLIQNGGLNNL
jgi:hypothetical protein